jgi:WD40 repeat protein
MWFRADGKALLTLDLGYTARLWDLAIGKLLVPPLRLPSPVRYGALSPDGSIAIIACDKNLHYWGLSSGEAREDSSLGAIREVSLSPTGTMLAACADGYRVLLWDRQLGRLQHTLNSSKVPESAAFSLDGALLAIGVGGDIKLWNTRTGKEMHTLIGHSGGVACPVFSPDGKTLASPGDDHTVKLWDVRAGLEVASFEEHTAPATGLAFTPDGATLISIGTGDGRGGEICTWSAASGDGDSPRK